MPFLVQKFRPLRLLHNQRCNIPMILFATAAFVLSVSISLPAIGDDKTGAPNIVLIMADDKS